MLRRRGRRDPDGSGDAALYDHSPAVRLDAARSLDARSAQRLQGAVTGWPAFSPAAVNAWLLLVTTKPPQWRDPLLEFPDGPLSVAEPHPGFLYPDPIDFWVEVRRWAAAVVGSRSPRLAPTDAVAVSGLLHVGDDPGRLAAAIDVVRPRVVLFLDESAWTAAALEPEPVEAHHVPDPHRPAQVYQGWWGRLPQDTGDGLIVGKAPQHPVMHRLYARDDMDRFLSACPRD